MAIITDGLLIATCLTAAIYCVVLSRRLARFSDTKTGIGQQISQLNEILEETRTTIKESHTGARSVSERLSRDLAAARKASQDLSALIERAETVLDRAIELQSRPAQPMRAPVAEAFVPSVQAAAMHDAPAPQPAEQAPESLPDDDPHAMEESGEALAERDFDLADARGEPQLGFLPSIDDTSAVQDLVIDSPDERRDSERKPDPAEDEPENLLQVERMAF